MMEDGKIVQLYVERDERAISETDAKYGKYCRSIASNIVHDNPTAGEVVNDTYLATWNSIPPTLPKVLSAYLAKICRNLSLKRWRAERAEKRGGGQVVVSIDEISEMAGIGDIPEHVEAKELAREIGTFLEQQPADIRNMFMRRYWYFDSIDEIACRFGYTPSKVKMSMKRTRDKLAEHLQREGYMNA